MPKVRIIEPSCPNLPPRPSRSVCLTLYLALLDIQSIPRPPAVDDHLHHNFGFYMVHWDNQLVNVYQLEQPYAPWKCWFYRKPIPYKGEWPEHSLPIAHLTYTGDVDRKHKLCEQTIRSIVAGDRPGQTYMPSCPCYTWAHRAIIALQKQGFIDPGYIYTIEQWCAQISDGETGPLDNGRLTPSPDPSYNMMKAERETPPLTPLPPASEMGGGYGYGYGHKWDRASASPAPAAAPYPMTAPHMYPAQYPVRYPAQYAGVLAPPPIPAPRTSATYRPYPPPGYIKAEEYVKAEEYAPDGFRIKQEDLY